MDSEQVQTERQQLPSLCQDSSSAHSIPWSCKIVIDKCNSYMKGPWLTRCACCWVLSTIVSCQSAADFSSGSDFSGVCVYVIFEAILLGPCLSAFSPLVLLNLWEGTPVTRGPVYAQSHRTPWQRVPCPVQASSLQAVPPRGLQWEDKCQHNYLAQTWWVRGVGGKMPPAKNQTKPRVPVCPVWWKWGFKGLPRARN